MIRATKKLNRGKTTAVATFDTKRWAWSVRLEGPCDERNRATVIQGYKQLLDDSTGPRSERAAQVAQAAVAAVGGWDMDTTGATS